MTLQRTTSHQCLNASRTPSNNPARVSPLFPVRAIDTSLRASSIISGIANSPSSTGISGNLSSRYNVPNAYRGIACDSGSPIVASRSPNSAAVTPLAIDCPESEPTIASPSMPSMNCSGDSNARMTGRIKGSEMPSAAAPHTPPMADDVNDAPSARAASPRFAMG